MLGELSYPFYIFNAIVITALKKVHINSIALTGQELSLSAIFVTIFIALLVLQIEMRWLEPNRANLAKMPKKIHDNKTTLPHN